MLGPVDLADWTYDECDLISALLRRHDAIHAIACGADARASAFPLHLRDRACRFARQEGLGFDDLCALAEAVGYRLERAA